MCNTLYSDVSKQSIPATISFSFKVDFPPLTNVGQLNLETVVTMSLLEVSLLHLISI